LTTLIRQRMPPMALNKRFGERSPSRAEIAQQLWD
jgi:hypothetical protein